MAQRQRGAESTAVVKPAESVLARHRCTVADLLHLPTLRKVMWHHKLMLTLTHLLTHSLTHLLTYSLAARGGHSPTLSSHGHRFEKELNRLAAETGCKGGEEGGNAPVSNETVQARLQNSQTQYSQPNPHRPHVPPPS